MRHDRGVATFFHLPAATIELSHEESDWLYYLLIDDPELSWISDLIDHAGDVALTDDGPTDTARRRALRRRLGEGLPDHLTTLGLRQLRDALAD